MAIAQAASMAASPDKGQDSRDLQKRSQIYSRLQAVDMTVLVMATMKSRNRDALVAYLRFSNQIARY